MTTEHKIKSHGAAVTASVFARAPSTVAEPAPAPNPRTLVWTESRDEEWRHLAFEWIAATYIALVDRGLLRVVK